MSDKVLTGYPLRDLSGLKYDRTEIIPPSGVGCTGGCSYVKYFRGEDCVAVVADLTGVLSA